VYAQIGPARRSQARAGGLKRPPGRSGTATRMSPPRVNAHNVGPSLDRLVCAGECVGPLFAQLERLPHEEELRRLASRRSACLHLRQQATVARPVDGTAVVRVDEAEVPELVSLVDVGDPGAGELEQRLAECDPLAEFGEPFRERRDMLDGCAREPFYFPLPGFVRPDSGSS
jgi:hypothetical protein